MEVAGLLMLFRERQIERIARKFHAMVRLACMETDLQVIDRFNALTPEKPCSSRGFVDADLFMAFAYEDVTGDRFDPQDMIAGKMTEAAWNLARAHGYANEW